VNCSPIREDYLTALRATGIEPASRKIPVFLKNIAVGVRRSIHLKAVIQTPSFMPHLHGSSGLSHRHTKKEMKADHHNGWC
jgi:hypothetical protein